MRFLLDQGVPHGTTSLLGRAGHDTIHVRDVGLGDADDKDILAQADAENRVVVTFDADFHQLLAISRAPGPSVVRIRIEGIRALEIMTILEETIRRCGLAMQDGAAVSVGPTWIRWRRLPFT
jgi:predicted nuclease of predicted toxin-antitoxin system